MPILTYLAEGVSSVNYDTSRVGSIATGFNLTISDTTQVQHDGEIEVGITGDTNMTVKLGSKFGIILSDGVTKTRTHTGRTTVIVDPIMDLFKKAIIINNTRGTYLERTLGKRIADSDFIVALTVQDTYNANDKLIMGDVTGFIDIMFGLTDGKSRDVVILTDKVAESPIIKSLSNLRSHTNWEEGKGSFFFHDASFGGEGLYTVESIYQQTLAPLGLELYWVKDNIYSLEPPRLTNPKALPEPVVIDKKDIISMDSISDPYNIPDLIIPSSEMNNVLGQGGHNVMASIIMQTGVLTNLSGKRSLKIQTYDIPNILMPSITLLMKNAAEAKDKSHGALPPITSDEAIENAITFFGSSARKSQLYKLSRGGCRLAFRPDITVPFSWYVIDGEEYFVTDVRHSITRSSAETRLTIGGKRNKDVEVSEETAKSSVDIKSIESEFLQNINKEVEKTISNIVQEGINQDRKLNNTDADLSPLSYNGGDIDSENMEKMFPSKESLQSVFNPIKEVHRTVRI
jgi:hypothetical protein